MTEKQRSSMSEDSSPDSYPVTPPPGFRADDHSWVLQTIMELQKSTGQLTQAVNTLTDQSKQQGKKLDSISHRVYAAAAVVTTIGGILYFVVSRMWDQVASALARIPIPPATP